jgi:predicted DNA-binding transcriptional regulator YafY
VRALAKLEQVLPSRLRHRVAALADAMVPVPGAGPTVASATRDRQRLRFDYTDPAGEVRRRDTEPHRLVHTGRRWYLVAWDVDRADWRTFRVDRMTPRIPTGPRFTPREPPEEDIAGYVTRGAGRAMWRYRARIRLQPPPPTYAPGSPRWRARSNLSTTPTACSPPAPTPCRYLRACGPRE